jgi:hypothetical protein
MLLFPKKIFSAPKRIDGVKKSIREFRDNCHDGLPNFFELGGGSFAAIGEAEIFWVGLAVLVVLNLLIKEFFEANFEFSEIVWLRNIITLAKKALSMYLLSY